MPVFGKGGFTFWHGAAITMAFPLAVECGFATTHAQDRQAGHAAALAAWDASGRLGPRPQVSLRPLDPDPAFATVTVHHVCVNSQKQDAGAVLTSVEALLTKFKRMMGDKLTGVTLCSDNAAYYKCDAMLPLLIGVSKACGVPILRYVNPAPQDGKR